MKATDVPQDNDPAYRGETKLVYAVDAKGKLIPVQTTGWSTERVVTAIAWQAIDQDLAKTRLAVSQRQASPLFYFMKFRQMDLALLAQNMALSRWRVWWHLRPKVFARLSERWVDRYAECLDIPKSVLRSCQSEPNEFS